MTPFEGAGSFRHSHCLPRALAIWSTEDQDRAALLDGDIVINASPLLRINCCHHAGDCWQLLSMRKLVFVWKPARALGNVDKGYAGLPGSGGAGRHYHLVVLAHRLFTDVNRVVCCWFSIFRNGMTVCKDH